MAKIIILEDDTDIAEIMQLAIGSLYDVLVANDFDKVKEVIVEYTPDLVITDYLLGQYVSSEVIAMIRTIDKFKNIPVILISGHPEIERIAKQLNVTDYLLKPFSLKNLNECIERILAYRTVEKLSNSFLTG